MVAFERGSVSFRSRVAAVILHEGHVLLGGEPDIPLWTLPGGGIDLLESSHEALEREMREELGVGVRIERLLWATELFFEREGKAHHEIGFYFLVVPLDAPHLFDLGREFPAVEGGPNPVTLRWFRLEDIEHLALYPKFLRTALQALPSTPQQMIDFESSFLHTG
jgi:8-oxo-dGTP pyrophosphatase MutT (NUDIX family)